jgi:hypothetical protein
MIKDVTSTFPYQQIVGLAASTGLTVPPRDSLGMVSTPTVAVIIVEGASIRWRDDGTAPTSTVGMPVAPGSVFIYDGDLTRIRFIQVTATATLNVSYYK